MSSSRPTRPAPSPASTSGRGVDALSLRDTELEARRQVLIALNAAPGLSRAAICRLAAGLGDWLGSSRSDAELSQVLGLAPRTLQRARRVAEQAGELAAQEQRAARRLAGYILTLLDAGYPNALRELPQPPPVLYCRGRLPRRAAVALVGSRRADAYGLEAAAVFSRELAAQGLVVVSGFARGVDITAHRSALAVEGGTTVAVLGCGLAVDYPARQAADRRRIAARGALLSEFPCHEPPRRANFPIRNRLIAALSASTVVIQAASRSGSLITARHALELGREVCAIPGPLFEDGWRGSNRLLRDGALLVESAADVVAALPLRVRSTLPPAARLAPSHRDSSAQRPALPQLDGEILAHLRAGRPRSVEELAGLVGTPIGPLLAALLRLELAGHACRHPGGAYSRRPCEPHTGDGSVPRHSGRRPE